MEFFTKLYIIYNTIITKQLVINTNHHNNVNLDNTFNFSIGSNITLDNNIIVNQSSTYEDVVKYMKNNSDYEVLFDNQNDYVELDHSYPNGYAESKQFIPLFLAAFAPESDVENLEKLLYLIIQHIKKEFYFIKETVYYDVSYLYTSNYNNSTSNKFFIISMNKSSIKLYGSKFMYKI